MEIKKDAQGNLINEKGEYVDEKGNIIRKEEPKAGPYKLEGLPEELKTQLPSNFDTLSQDEQMKEFAKVANVAKSAKDKEQFVQKQASELGILRKFKEEAEPILNAIKNKSGKTSEDEEFDKLLEEAKTRYDENDFQFINKIIDYKNQKANTANKKLLGRVLEGNLNMMMQFDKDIDQNLYKENYQDILKEYNRFREPDTFEAMVENLKEAALKVQEKAVKAMSKEEQDKYETKRKARLGGLPPTGPSAPKDKDAKPWQEEIKEGILNAGKKKGGGVFG